MKAEIVSVGTELLLGTTVDTNAAQLGEALARYGIACTHRQTVGDNLERLTDALRLALSRADLVITIGGLGPTMDDLTRDGIAAALEDELTHDPEIEAHLRDLYAKRKLRWVDSVSRQAMRPASGSVLENAFGTAPGLVCRKAGKVVCALPGPPREFGPMMSGPLALVLAELSGGRVIHSRTLRVCGLGESRVEELTHDLMGSENPTVAPYAKPFEVHLRLTAAAETLEEAGNLIRPLEEQVRQRLGWHVYGADEDTLESAVWQALHERGQTVCTAESCTGGLLAGRLTEVPGASTVFVGGVVAYNETVKTRELGVPDSLLREHTAVSEAVAVAMAEGARHKFGADFALSVTGVAGPGPDADGHPEGMVVIALAREGEMEVGAHHLGRGRASVRQRATQAALTLLWKRLHLESEK